MAGELSFEFEDSDVMGGTGGFTKMESVLHENTVANISNILQRQDTKAPKPASPSAAAPAASTASATPPARHRFDPKTIKPSMDFHTVRQPSILAASAPPQDFRGLCDSLLFNALLTLCFTASFSYNLLGIILVVMNARLCIENLYKYGLLLRFNAFEHIFTEWPRTWPSLVDLLLLIAISPVVAYLTERAAFAYRLPLKTVAYIHTAHILTVFFGPILVIHYSNAILEAGMILLFAGLIFTMKLISYAHVYNDIRRDLFGKGKDEKPKFEHDPAPRLGHLYYFLAAPTLCFQLSYPLSPKIRWRFVLRRLAELLFCMALQLFLIEQYVMPTVKNSLEYMDKGDWGRIIERAMKLAIPNTAIWLLMFYSLFHSWLNFTGELLRFGDRLFYRDWWNAQSLDVYWRNWNLPVHNWIVRHLYAPATRHGFTSLQAQAIAFFASAVLHEVLVSVPCHTIRLWAFFGMMLQVPLIAITRYFVKTLKQPVYGNLLFWTSFLVFGQPLLILLYAHDFVRQHMVGQTFGAHIPTPAGPGV